MTRAAKVARAAGVAVVADLERDEWPGFAGLLALVDHLIVSRDFAARLTGQADPAAAAEHLWRDDRQSVVVTCGEHGCWCRGRQGPARHFPAFRVAAVDTTGCGDVFHGAYAAALARGEGLDERVRFASAAAALKATAYGAQAGIPDRPAVARFLGVNPSTG
jgi:sugar/nucleoside kinase (ribokinase family)